MRYFPKNIAQLFIKPTHSFVAIELLTFFKNPKKNYFIAQYSSRYSVRKQDWFFAICVYKNVLQKNRFLNMNENYDDCHHRKTTRTFLYTKRKRNCQYKKPDTFQKARQFPLRFIYKKLDTSQKARQFAIRFYIHKPGTFA